MRKISLLFALIMMMTMVWAEQADYIHNPNQMKLPLAATDDVYAGKVNPAAAAFGNAGGFGYLRGFDDESLTKNYSLMFTTSLAGFVYDRYNKSNYYSLYASSETFKNLYIGANWNWKDHTFDTGRFGASMLYRPINCVSIGAAYNKRFVTSFDGVGSVNEKEIYSVGIAAKPLFFMPEYQNRLTLTADANIYSGELKSPTLGISTELINGIYLGGYADLEEETFGINTSIAIGHSKDGVITHHTQNDVNGVEKGFQGGLYHSQYNFDVLRGIKFDFGSKKYYELNLDKVVVDKADGFKLGPIFLKTGKEMELADLLNLLKNIENDKSYDGIVVKPTGFGTNLANYIEIKDAFLSLKKSGKKVIFYFENIGNFNYAFAASVADEIYMNPNGMAEIKGFAMSMPYIKGLLDTLGVDVVNFRSHKYKTAMNMFSETEMTPTEREALQYILDGITAEYKKLVVGGRGDKLKESIDSIIENGPYFDSRELIAKGLVDDLIYENDLKDKINELEDDKVLFMNDVMNVTYNYDWTKPKTANVAIVYADGNIHSGKSIVGTSIGSKTYADAIEKARKNKSIDAVILRVNSGGGGAIASDIIANEVKKCTQGDDAKPVYASMGGYAASGGYFISCHADKIYADPTTITGSIGVVGMMMSGEELLKKVKVNFSTVKTSKYADMGSFNRKMTDDEKAKIEKYIHLSYDSFIGNVAEGRGMTKEAVHEVAQGRVWTGVQAKERGLVDEIGSLEDVKEELKKQLGVDKLVLLEYPESESTFSLEFDAGFPLMGSANLLPEQITDQMKQIKQLTDNSREKVLFILPFLLNQSYE